MLRMMLQENLTPEDLDRAIAESEKNPYFTNVSVPLNFQKSGELSGISWRSFWIKKEDGKRVDFVSREFLHPESRRSVIIHSQPDIQLDKSQMFEAFDKLNKELNNVFGTENSTVKCFQPITDLLAEWHEKTFSDCCLKKFPLVFFYMSEDQRARLLEDTKDGIPLPEGYYWDEADPEKDTKVMIETWKHSSDGDYERIQTKLRNLPSSMIRVTGTGEPVAFEHVDPCGFLNHHFVQPAHRSKGLGVAVENDLSVKLIKKGILHFKDVETINSLVVDSSDRSPYWTKRKDAEGNPTIFMFFKVAKKEAIQN